MITRDPDVTRLLDRLEKRGLISRCRETGDRRTVMVRITPEGLDTLARLDEPVQAAHRKQLQHLGRERLHNLAELLRASRSQVAITFILNSCCNDYRCNASNAVWSHSKLERKLT